MRTPALNGKTEHTTVMLVVPWGKLSTRYHMAQSSHPAHPVTLLLSRQPDGGTLAPALLAVSTRRQAHLQRGWPTTRPCIR